MRSAGVALVALGLLLAGCGSGEASPSGTATTSAAPSPTPAAVPPVAAVPGIEAEAVRLRTDEAVGGRLQVRRTDTGTARPCPLTSATTALECAT